MNRKIQINKIKNYKLNSNQYNYKIKILKIKYY